MKLMLWMLMFVICMTANAQDTSAEITGADKNVLFKEATNQFQQGR